MDTKVLIIELATHNEVLETYLSYALHLNCEISVITTKRNLDFISIDQEDKIRWQVKDNIDLKEKDIHFIDQHDICIVTTMPTSGHHFLTKSWNIPTAVLIHNATTYLQSNENRVKINSLKVLARLIKYKLLSISKKRKNALKSFDMILLPSKQIFSHVSNNFNIAKRRKISFIPIMSPLPPDFELKVEFRASKDSLNIVIPGTVSSNIRAYHLVLRSLLYLDTTNNKHVQLTLLGKTDKKSASPIVKLAKQFKHIKINYYNQVVSQVLFDRKMREADFYIMPINQNIVNGNHYEIFGETWTSGNVNDLMKYAKPAIVSECFNISYEWDSLLEKYQSEAKLKEILSNWIGNRAFLKKTAPNLNQRQQLFERNTLEMKKVVNRLLELKT